MRMRDEALIHFHRDGEISPGIHLSFLGTRTAEFIAAASGRYDPLRPGRSAAGFCAMFFDLVWDLYPPPPQDWRSWGFFEWDRWFGVMHGTFLVDLAAREVVQFPIYRTSGKLIECDLSGMSGDVVPFPAERIGLQR